MNHSRVTLPLLVWAGWLLVAVVLRNGPPSLAELLNAAHHNLMGLVLTTVDSVGNNVPFLSSARQSQNVPEQGEEMVAEYRELLLRNAQLRNEIAQLSKSPSPSLELKSSSLVQVEAIDARVLGTRQETPGESLNLIVSLGKRAGLVGEELVLKGTGVLVDRGEDFDLTADQLVTAGKSLFGRTARIGRWTTLVQPMTDSEFATAVRLVRRSALGPVLGPRGILKGTGHGCILTDIVATEAVAVGDEVYTDNFVSPLAEPIYCGRIIKAEVEPTDSHWTIEVEPATHGEDLPATLQVLKVRLNPERLAAEGWE